MSSGGGRRGPRLRCGHAGDRAAGSSSSPRPSSSRQPTCRGAPTPTAARRWPSSPAGPATSPGPSRTRRTATNAGYLRHILEVGHLSVLEHGTVSFYLTGVSRSLTHELIRHRHFSYSQLSQRYVPERDAAMVEPEVIAADPELHALFTEAAAAVGEGLRGAAGGPGEAVRRRAQRHAAPQAGPPGGAGDPAQRHRDPHRRHRQLPRVAALHRHAGHRARRRRDPRARRRVPAPAAARGAQRVRRLRDRHARRRHARSPPARSSPRDR